MSLTTIAIALLLGSAVASTRGLRRNRLYDVTAELRRFDEAEAATESLFRELLQDDITMRFLNCMSYSMSMSMDTTTTTTTTSSPTTDLTSGVSTPAPSTSAPAVPGSPSAAPISTTQGAPSTKTTGDVPANDGGNGGCTFNATAFENDASSEVLLKMDVETTSSSTDFLDGLMDAVLAALQEEFGLCLPSGSSRTLTASRREPLVGDNRRLEDALITGVTLGDTELPSDQSCGAAIGNTCHVVYSGVVVYGSTQEEASAGAGRVVALLQDQDFTEGDIVDVRVAERKDDGSISNGVSNINNELAVDANISSHTGSGTGLAIGLSVVGVVLLATIAIVALSRRRPAEEGEDDISIRKEYDAESDNDTDDDDEETFVNPMDVPQPYDDATVRSMRRMDTVEL